jgi:hypothetical protein
VSIQKRELNVDRETALSIMADRARLVPIPTIADKYKLPIRTIRRVVASGHVSSQQSTVLSRAEQAARISAVIASHMEEKARCFELAEGELTMPQEIAILSRANFLDREIRENEKLLASILGTLAPKRVTVSAESLASEVLGFLEAAQNDDDDLTSIYGDDEDDDDDDGSLLIDPEIMP